MQKFKLLAAAILMASIAAPVMAQAVYRDNDGYYRDRGPVGTAAGVAAGVAGAAVGTAAAIADAPFRNSYDNDGYYKRGMGPSGFACEPGTWFKGADGRRHRCQ
jgi:hypothetical protein